MNPTHVEGRVSHVAYELLRDGNSEGQLDTHAVRNAIIYGDPVDPPWSNEVKRLVTALAHHTGIKTLKFVTGDYVVRANIPESGNASLEQNRPSDEQFVELFGQGLAQHPTIQKIVFVGSRIDTVFLTKLTESVPVATLVPMGSKPASVLTSLSFDNVSLDNDAYVAIKAMLERGVRLTFLKVHHHDSLDEQGCRLICDGAAVNGHLLELHLNGGFAIEERTLRGAICPMSSITNLVVFADSWRSKDDYSGFIRALWTNRHLQTLKIVTNIDDVPDDGQFDDLCRNHHSSLKVAEFWKVGQEDSIQLGMRPPHPVYTGPWSVRKWKEEQESGLYRVGDVDPVGASSAITFNGITRCLFYGDSDSVLSGNEGRKYDADSSEPSDELSTSTVSDSTKSSGTSRDDPHDFELLYDDDDEEDDEEDDSTEVEGIDWKYRQLPPKVRFQSPSVPPLAECQWRLENAVDIKLKSDPKIQMMAQSALYFAGFDANVAATSTMQSRFQRLLALKTEEKLKLPANPAALEPPPPAAPEANPKVLPAGSRAVGARAPSAPPVEYEDKKLGEKEDDHTEVDSNVCLFKPCKQPQETPARTAPPALLPAPIAGPSPGLPFSSVKIPVRYQIPSVVLSPLSVDLLPAMKVNDPSLDADQLKAIDGLFDDGLFTHQTTVTEREINLGIGLRAERISKLLARKAWALELMQLDEEVDKIGNHPLSSVETMDERQLDVLLRQFYPKELPPEIECDKKAKAKTWIDLRNVQLPPIATTWNQVHTDYLERMEKEKTALEATLKATTHKRKFEQLLNDIVSLPPEDALEACKACVRGRTEAQIDQMQRDTFGYKNLYKDD